MQDCGRKTSPDLLCPNSFRLYSSRKGSGGRFEVAVLRHMFQVFVFVLCLLWLLLFLSLLWLLFVVFSFSRLFYFSVFCFYSCFIFVFFSTLIYVSILVSYFSFTHIVFLFLLEFILLNFAFVYEIFPVSYFIYFVLTQLSFNSTKKSFGKMFIKIIKFFLHLSLCHLCHWEDKVCVFHRLSVTLFFSFFFIFLVLSHIGKLIHRLVITRTEKKSACDFYFLFRFSHSIFIFPTSFSFW